jgi:hypothetical protein
MTWLVQHGRERQVREKVSKAAAEVLAEGRLSTLAQMTLRGYDRHFAESLEIAIKSEDASTIFEGRDRAVLGAVEAAFSIGMFAGAHRAAKEGPEFWQRDKAVLMRERRAQQAEGVLVAVRAAMLETPAKPTLGEAFARLIRPDVEKRLKRLVSLSTIRRYVRTIVKERT